MEIQPASQTHTDMDKDRKKKGEYELNKYGHIYLGKFSFLF